MNKTLIAFLFICVLSYFETNAQTPARVIYFEMGGPGLASLNYDMRFTKSEKGIGGRIGLGVFDFDNFELFDEKNIPPVVLIPLSINYLLGKDDKYYFELGAGVTFIGRNDSDDKLSKTFGHLNFLYRMQPKRGGLFFKVGVCPIFGKGFFIPYYGGVAFGYKF